MAEPLNLPPFPPLSWDTTRWVGQTTIHGFTATRVDLVVLVKWTPDQIDESSAQQPTTPQATAFQYLLNSGAQIKVAVLAAILECVPEWENEDLDEGDWTAPMEFARVFVLTSVWDGVAYIGFEFNSFEFEHGIGVVTHQDRVVYVGMAEESHDDGSAGAAARDVQRLKRAQRKGQQSA